MLKSFDTFVEDDEQTDSNAQRCATGGTAASDIWRSVTLLNFSRAMLC